MPRSKPPCQLSSRSSLSPHKHESRLHPLFPLMYPSISTTCRSVVKCWGGPPRHCSMFTWYTLTAHYPMYTFIPLACDFVTNFLCPPSTRHFRHSMRRTFFFKKYRPVSALISKSRDLVLKRGKKQEERKQIRQY